MKKAIVVLLLVLMSLPLMATGSQEVKDGPETVTLAVWTREGGINHWRADLAVEAVEELNAQLKAEGSDITVEVEAYLDEGDWGNYKKKYSLAADAGEAPAIVCSGHEDIPVWSRAGYIVPVSDSVQGVKALAPQFDDIFDSLWQSSYWQNEVWGIPQDTEARPMYFSTTKLKMLGWDDARIAALPSDMAEGRFTLDDLLVTAKEAVDKGIVEPGYGYWHRPRKGGDFVQFYKAYGGEFYDADQDKLIIDRDALVNFYDFQRKTVTTGVTPGKYIGTEWKIWHDVVANNKALFWNGGTWMWADWAKNYAVGGEDTLWSNVGFGYEPSGIRGEKGVTLSHPLVYLVSSEDASGNKHQDLAIRLIALMSTTERNTRHAVESGHLGILKSQSDFAPYKESKFLADVTYLLDNNFYQPNHVMYGLWFDAFWEGMVSAEQGDKTPEQAADDAIKVMKIEIEDQLIVR
ncbi:MULTISPECIES: ABC transporter substrate-binding protein [unclassified Oceanispirochaeta]|uniref:ABC transporter substrate-binding protein n=1 Tax=unclassified Oceanispirochaeta TaxID=2635722 RepID=UPI000E097634|nr:MULTISPECIES: twin-arginine translocation pathway signal protein [unclassified Oceanispirochaeta]MBF9014617.1 twin-arginine translocation pathway signal protein [Oceanispirochaeta sp. M2]NPD70873.1 twin-arginine translocation pathway signal protein [Oceanispirochaeta sp. M1]RDG34152.1 twin-arginine translocation pathway signal protein [Oceanispirochaeta sp. M1]